MQPLIALHSLLVVICPVLEDPGNGTVDVSGNRSGDTAVYSCNVGFTLDGENRTCGDDGQWSGSEPTCVSTLRAHLSHAVKVFNDSSCS